MDQQEFIDIIKDVVIEDGIMSIQTNLVSPPGRKPSQKLIAASNFYKSLNDGDKMVFTQIIRDCVEVGVWGFLCVLDGVRAIEDYEKGKLTLTYEKNGQETVLNNPSEYLLHELL